MMKLWTFYQITMSYTNIHQVFENSTHTLSYLHDKIIKGFDSGLLTGIVFIGLQKAFDTIDQNILIKKNLF